MSRPSTPDRDAAAFVAAFVDELARAGVRDVCAAPGSRSTPLALTVARHPDMSLRMHLDERSAAFFALGIARARGAPAAIICTSGTAAANFFPAVVEAQAAGVPLLVLTADRPPELRDVGAAQTIDQNQLYGAHVKWFVEVALPEASTAMLRYARMLANRAAAVAASVPAGPVHLNFPFREPLVPASVAPPQDLTDAEREAWTGRPAGAPWVSVARSYPIADSDTVQRVATLLRRSNRPLVVCGPQYDAALRQPLAELAATLGAPLLADPLSQLRWGPHDRSAVIEAYDAFLRTPRMAETFAPDVVLRVGGPPTSKALLEYVGFLGGAEQIVVTDGRWPDPALTAAWMVHADPARLCGQLVERLGADPAVAAGSSRQAWLRRWQECDAEASRALRTFCASLDESFEGRALAEVADLMPDGSTLFVSSSMPVRDLDTFGRGSSRDVRVLANRGANGIDGVVSTALGAASAGTGAPLVLVIGDVAMYHDMNGLLAGRQLGLDATIVLLNNDGGGIFSFLPQAAHPEHFELLFGTPHGLDFSHAARMYGAEYCRPGSGMAAPGGEGSWDAFRRAVQAGISGGGLHMVEMRTERTRNVELHRQARDAVAAAVATRSRA